MRWFWVLLCCVGVGACGFKPLYMSENNQNVVQEAEKIQIAPIPNAGGYQMNVLLRQKLNPKQIIDLKKWELRVQLKDPVFYDQSIRGDNFTSLEKMTLTASYQLVDLKTNTAIVSSDTSASGSYNIVNEPYATITAKEKMYQNLIRILADDISLHIFSYLRGREQ